MWGFYEKEFQSTPSWRGRPLGVVTRLNSKTFQSTPSWRGRLYSIEVFWCFVPISIHALVKRATIASLRLLSLPQYFNPRPREEGDKPHQYEPAFRALFQSTPSWRGRLHRLLSQYRSCQFQSTPSWRGRPNGLLDAWNTYKFQSTPSWRGRLTHLLEGFKCMAFQSTPSWRGRPLYCPWSNAQGHFNPRPREEGDRPSSAYSDVFSGFQSTPSWRGRQHRGLFVYVPYYISIHALVKRATLPQSKKQ